MKKRIMCLLVLCLFILSNTAFATNWVYLSKSSSYKNGNEYIDTDTVFKDGNILSAWVLIVLDKPLPTGAVKLLYKMNFQVSNSRTARLLESYSYDANGKETVVVKTPGNWFQLVAGDPGGDTFLQYAKEGQDSGQKPTP
jgi:hypothetical protein